MKDVTEKFKSEFWKNIKNQIAQDDLLANRDSLFVQPKQISKCNIRSIFISTMNVFLPDVEDKWLLYGEVLNNEITEEEISLLFNQLYPTIESFLAEEEMITITNDENI